MCCRLIIAAAHHSVSEAAKSRSVAEAGPMRKPEAIGKAKPSPIHANHGQIKAKMRARIVETILNNQESGARAINKESAANAQVAPISLMSARSWLPALVRVSKGSVNIGWMVCEARWRMTAAFAWAHYTVVLRSNAITKRENVSKLLSSMCQGDRGASGMHRVLG
jgi:hypothetical protein